jgi:hypothetical protein
MTHEREGEGGESIRARASHDLLLEKREGEACSQSQEREGKMDAGILALGCGSAIKHGKMAPEGLAGGFWLKSYTPLSIR